MLIALCALFLISGCSKNSIYIDLGRDPGGNDSSGSSSNSKTLVTFNAAVEGRNMTRAMSPMGKGIQSQLYAFEATKAASLGNPDAEGTYITLAPGILGGVDGYKMYLSNGVYNFYAVSNNFSEIPPTFTAGKSERLANGTDYLWWKGVQQDVTSSQIIIPIVYLHSATQVVFEVSAGTGLKLDKLVSATITPSQPGSSMYLSNGVIPPIDKYDNPVQMGINGFLTQYIMLPLETQQPMNLTLDILADGETAARKYSVPVPVPDGELKAGNSYFFSAVIDGNKVSFPVVSVKAWTEVDETGKPLYPTQK